MALGLTPYQIIEKGTHPQLVIADDWKRIELKHIATVQNGFAFSSKLFNHNEGLPLIRIRDIFSSETQNLYSGEYKDEFLVSKGDILIGMDGDFKVSKWPGKKGLLNQRVCRILFNSNQYEKEFLFLCIQPYLDAIHSETSAVTVKHLSSRTINDIPFPLPPLVEQKAIVKKIEELFSSLDSGIADLKKAQDQLVIYRQAVLKKAFEGFKEVPFEEIITSSQNGMSKRRGSEGKEIKVLRLADITKLAIDNSTPRSILLNNKEFDKYKLCQGDLLAIRVNGSINLVGRFVHVSNKDESEEWAFCDHLIRVKLDKKVSEPKFYYYYLQIPEVRKFIHENMVSSAGQNTVSQSTVKSISVPIASIEEQHQIVSDIESRLSVCDTVEKDIADSLEKAQALRQSILKKAFEGKLLSEEEIAKCKADKNYEPASVLLDRIKAEKKKK